jgi:hypothetical protein
LAACGARLSDNRREDHTQPKGIDVPDLIFVLVTVVAFVILTLAVRAGQRL